MIIKDNNYKVMKLFFDNPEKKFHIRKIARLVGLSPPGILKIVKKLERQGLLVSEKKEMLENISASRDEGFIQLKRCDNLISLFRSGLVSFLRETYEEPEAIVVFGSYAKGEDLSISDIDIAIVTSKREKLDLKKFENTLKRKINIYEVKVKQCKSEFLNNLANGVVLSGYLKVIP